MKIAMAVFCLLAAPALTFGQESPPVPDSWLDEPATAVVTSAVCEADTCWTCTRPAAGVDSDYDGIPDQLEFDLAHKYFPTIWLQGFSKDLAETYLYRNLAIPYTVQPLAPNGICFEDKKCLEIRYGLAYRYDHGDDYFWFIDNGHLGDSEFYAGLVMRNAAWSSASSNPASWNLVRDFTAAHWTGSGDSSRVGAYGFCPTYPACYTWDNYEQGCLSHPPCHWFPGLCTGVSSEPGTSCSSFWQEGDCYFAGCQWYDSSCDLPETAGCYSNSLATTARTLYASEWKHGLYHTDSECENGGFLDADACPSNSYNMRLYKAGKLQNVGSSSFNSGFDTTIQHPDMCSLYGVWSGNGFAESTPYRQHFLAGFAWNLPADTTGGVCYGTPGQWSGCRGNGCAVCSELVASYPLYFVNHPQCARNSTCGGLYYTCNANCPAPAAADACNGTSGQWAGCRGNGCAVCSELVASYPCYFLNHPACSPNGGCGGLYYTCNANCPTPTAADRC